MSREQQELMAKALTGEGLDAPILIYGSSVSGAHKVHDSPEWFQSCLFCNKCRALPYHIFPGGVLAGTTCALIILTTNLRDEGLQNLDFDLVALSATVLFDADEKQLRGNLCVNRVNASTPSQRVHPMSKA
ncbi:hypothetical protein HGM15179_003163 [Zosterops borbonicus]|uniref:Uncharacterized protein n=1 Tax=Zosterops borbonicus TaxID=364589 RepID=A0A8K1GRM4_9PASS|nr:hypothetical protein HGM15179_003163 [Zosterops borbonicus]